MKLQTPNRSRTQIDRFIGRQPILDEHEQTVGYELLHRASQENRYCGTDGDQATGDIIDQIINLGSIDDLCHGRQAYLNMPRDVLMQGRYTLLPPRRVMLELLEDVLLDEEVQRACRKLKQRGYRLALDDVTDPAAIQAMLPMVDVVKVDCMLADAAAQTAIVQAARDHGVPCLAEKVETREQFDECRRIGFRWFQGYFFQKPEVIARTDLPPWVATYLRFLAALTKDEMDFAELELTLKSDVALSVKLLRYLNSERFDLAEEVKSIRQAMVLLGEKPLRQWAAVVGIACMAQSRPAQIVVDSLVRARCCELLAAPLGLGPQRQEMFLMGLLSMLDVLVQQPLDELLVDLPVSYAVRTALLGGNSPLLDALNLVRSCERQDLASLDHFASARDTTAEAVWRVYDESMRWSSEIFGDLST